MNFAVLRALHDRLRENPVIPEFLTSWYPSSPCSFFVGLKPDLDKGLGIPADRFPYVAVSPLQSDQEARPSKNTGDRVSIMFGVYDDQETEGLCIGVEGICRLGSLILIALEGQPLSKTPMIVWDGEAQTLFEVGTHPYYEAEIMITLEVRQ